MPAKTMTGAFYLVIHPRSWDRLSARLTTAAPSLTAGEVAIKLNINVPGALFTQPQIQASVVIPEDAVTPPVLDAQVLDNVREVLEQHTGMAIKLSVVEPQPNAH